MNPPECTDEGGLVFHRLQSADGSNDARICRQFQLRCQRMSCMRAGLGESIEAYPIRNGKQADARAHAAVREPVPRGFAYGDGIVGQSHRTAVKPFTPATPRGYTHAVARIDYPLQWQSIGREYRVVVRRRIVGVQYSCRHLLQEGARTSYRPGVNALALAAHLHHYAARAEFISQGAALEQAYDPAFMPRLALRANQVDDGTLQPAALELLDEMGNLHATILFIAIPKS